MVLQTNTAHQEATEMLTKTRTIIITLIAAASFAVAALVPAVSQAQWHNYCVKGQCTEHANYTYGNPCSSSPPVLALTPEAQKEEEQRKKKEEEEGKVHGEEIEKSFYGCDTAPNRPSSSGGAVSKLTVTTSRAIA
jgi:hypothetical protein